MATVPVELQDTIPLSTACLRARLSRERLLRRIHRGELRGYLVLGRWVVDAVDFDRFIKQAAADAGLAAE